MTKLTVMMCAHPQEDECAARIAARTLLEHATSNYLMGRLLYAIFGRKAPAVRHLRIDNLHDQIPDDVIECWAACYWAIQACASNANSTNLLRASVPHLIASSEKIYRLTGLRLPELKSEDITAVFDSMSKRFAMRLGLSEQELSNAHLHTSEHVSSSSSRGS